MRFLVIFVLSTVFLTLHAIYDHGPAERFWDLLKGLDSAKQAELQKIVYDPDLTKRQVVDKVKEWVEDQSSQVKALHSQSLANYEERDKVRNERLNKKDEKLSVAGKELDAEIRAIYDNMDLTDRQTCESVSEVISSSALTLQLELGIEPMDCENIFSRLHKV